MLIDIDLRIAKLKLVLGDVLIVKVPESACQESVHLLSEVLNNKGIEAIVISGEFDLSILKRDARLSVRNLIREVGLLKNRIEELESGMP